MAEAPAGLSWRIGESGRVTFMAATGTSQSAFPGLRRWIRTSAMETFCSTLKERLILENHSARRRLQEQQDHAMD